MATALSLSGLPISAVEAQDQPGARFRSSTSIVAVDVVVRDGAQRPVVGLTQEDFEVYENGRRQQIVSFAAVGQAPRAATQAVEGVADQSAGSASPVERVPAVAALVFDQLSPAGRQLAVAAARRLVGSAAPGSKFVAIFAVDRALHPVVGYTANRSTLDRGLDIMAGRAGFPLERASDVPGAEYRTADAGQLSQAAKDDSPFARGHATLGALERVISSLAIFPGRKAVVLFSEGLALGAPKQEPLRPTGQWHDMDTWLSDNRGDHFNRVVAAAGRAQVSFYTFDAAGLRTSSPLIDPGFGEPPYVGLQYLADETGGSFVENTNDLGPGTERAAADLQSYYLLGYVSSRPPDGKYRELQVKVDVENVTVLARRGYVASREPPPVQLRPNEIAPLLALDQPTLPHDFPFNVEVLADPQPAAPGRIRIVAAVPNDSVHFERNGSRDHARLTILVRVKDSRGQPIKYAGEQFQVAVPFDAPHLAGPGAAWFAKETDLPVPGSYTVETAACDELDRRCSARLVSVDISAARKVPFSSLMVLDGAVHASAKAAAAGPGVLHFGEWLLRPRFDHDVQRGGELPFGFSAFFEGNNYRATATILKGGSRLAASELALPAPDEHGRIVYVGRIPLADLPPGTYQLLVALAGERGSENRWLTFRIVGPQP